MSPEYAPVYGKGKDQLVFQLGKKKDVDSKRNEWVDSQKDSVIHPKRL